MRDAKHDNHRGSPIKTAEIQDKYSLSNSYFSIEFSCAGNIALSSFQLNTSIGFFGKGFHEFMFTNPDISALTSSSGLFLVNQTWLLPSFVSNQSTVNASSTSVLFQNLLIGSPAIASEDWLVQLLDDELVWTVDRRFLAPQTDLIADRTPAIVFDSLSGGVPSFLDTELILNGSSGGFLLNDKHAQLGEVLSARTHQSLQISPQGLRLDLHFDSGFFSFAKMPVGNIYHNYILSVHVWLFFFFFLLVHVFAQVHSSPHSICLLS